MSDRFSIISASNNMFGRAIWDKLPECIFENFLGNFKIFKNRKGNLCQKSPESDM